MALSTHIRSTPGNDNVGVISLRSAAGPPACPEPRIRARLSLQRLSFALIVLLVGWRLGTRQVFGQNLQPDNQSNVVHGTVVNAVTREPIGRALVYRSE